ncbi:hypothetical protein OIV83_002111 [Microbotryomycetes sp. JL201]|nr:hypothetical protein OIV83_002111 [Microbotryomycetes sp. JL201]
MASNVARGTVYEHLIQQLLSEPPLSVQGLLRVGGAGDKGVDLRGWWTQRAFDSTSVARAPQLSSSTVRRPQERRLPVVVQCKAENRKLGPQIIRELEGVAGYETGLKQTVHNRSISYAHAGQRHDRIPNLPTLAFLCGLSGFSKEAYNRALASSCPLSLVHVECPSLSDLALRHQQSRESLKCIQKRVNVMLNQGSAGSEKPVLKVVSWTMNQAFRDAVGPGWETVLKRSLVSDSRSAELQYQA